MLEETTDPVVADDRNFFKVELWTRNGQHIQRILYAGSSLDRARAVFAEQVRRRPTSELTIRQRTCVLRKWPE